MSRKPGRSARGLARALEQARAQLAGVLQSTVTSLVATIREPAARMVFVLDAIKRKLEEGGEAA